LQFGYPCSGAIVEAQASGLRVPQDLAVIGFGDLDFAADTHPPSQRSASTGRLSVNVPLRCWRIASKGCLSKKPLWILDFIL
jgi:hypothetical protein